MLALSVIKDILDYKRFCNLPLGLVLEYEIVLIYSHLVNDYRLSKYLKQQTKNMDC